MKKNFGIIVSGGPAPGINSVIASVTFSAHKNGFKTIGFNGGLKGIVDNGSESIVPLTVETTIPIANTGGSILGTSRFNPFLNEESKLKLINTIKESNVDKLVMIGGEGSAYLSHIISEEFPELNIAHIPKTIDNDLMLPNKHPSFGFETARYAGTRLLRTLMSEAKTTKRWFVIKTMGRNAGFLALGLGIASGAAVTLIPEQFKKGITPDEVAQLVFKSIKSKLASGQNFGCAVLAEGIIDKFDPDKVPELSNASIDEVGRLNFSEVKLENLVVSSLKKLSEENDLDLKFTPENIGYVLRCREPVPFDIEYTRFLGYGAVKFLLEGQRAIMVVRDFDNLTHIKLKSMLDDNGNQMLSRSVDLDSDLYKVASSFMVK